MDVTLKWHWVNAGVVRREPELCDLLPSGYQVVRVSLVVLQVLMPQLAVLKL